MTSLYLFKKKIADAKDKKGQDEDDEDSQFFNMATKALKKLDSKSGRTTSIESKKNFKSPSKFPLRPVVSF